MSYDDDNRGYPHNGQPSGRDPGRERGAYTPPTGDDDLPFSRSGYDPRRAPASKSPPLTLIVSVLVLLAIIAFIIFGLLMGGSRKEGDVPPATGTEVNTIRFEAPVDAQPVNPEEDIRVYRDTATPEGETPTLAPEPEEVLPRPAPQLDAPAPVSATPPPAPKAATPAAPAVQAPVTTAPPAPKAAPKAATPAPAPAAAATGDVRVQIGAFSSREQAEREYASAASRHVGLASGAQRTITPVQSNGKTLYRTSFGGMSRERANALCDAIKRSGGQCFLA